MPLSLQAARPVLCTQEGAGPLGCFLPETWCSQQNQTFIAPCWNSAHLEVRALLREMPLAHYIHIYRVGFPLGSFTAASVEGV